MIYLQLFYEFFKIGLFAVGGGMATIPFLTALGENTGWYTNSFVTDMIAISESTPGPIGINMATYVGYSVGGVWGGIIATFAEILPSMIIVTFVSKTYTEFRYNKNIGYMFYGLRPAVTALIASAALTIFKVSVINYDLFTQTGLFADLWDIKKLVYFVVIFIAIKKYNKNPIVYIAFSAVIGIILNF